MITSYNQNELLSNFIRETIEMEGETVSFVEFVVELHPVQSQGM